MKKCLLFFFFVSALVIYSYDFEIEVINLTETDIVELYVSPDFEMEWGENLLVNEFLINEHAFVIELNEINTRTFDFLLVDETGNNYILLSKSIRPNRLTTIEIDASDIQE